VKTKKVSETLMGTYPLESTEEDKSGHRKKRAMGTHGLESVERGTSQVTKRKQLAERNSPTGVHGERDKSGQRN